MKKITSYQMGALIYLLSLSKFLGTTSNILIHTAHQDAWISVIFSVLISFFPFYFIIKIIEYKPELDIFGKTEFLFGKFFGTIINILFVVMFLFLSTIALWDLNNFISSQYLHMTPSYFIGLFMMIAVIYILSKDLVVIARTGFILFIIGFTLYSLGFIGLVSQVRIDRIMPMLENGILPVIKGGVLSMIYDVLPLFVLTVIPRDRIEIKKMTSLFKWFYFSGFIIFAIVFFLVSIFGYKLASIYQYSAFHLLKNIELFGFINRIESTISIRWIFYLIATIVTSLYFVIQFIKKMFKIENKKIINLMIIGLGFVILILSEFIFSNNIAKEIFMFNYFPFISGIILGIIPLIIFIFSKFKKARL